MEVAHIHVSGTQAHPGRVQPITAGIVGAVVRMSYTDDPWDGLIRNVVFRHEGKSVVILNAGKSVQLPAELVAEPSREPVFVGVCGVDADDTVLVPTLWAKIGPVNPSPSLFGEPAADPSLPIWAQLQQADARIEQKADMALAANPDWSQNDPDKPDYVKNRTHYVETVDGGEHVYPLPEKFIPETIARKDTVTRVQQIAEKALYAVDNFIPLVAEVGQVIAVKEVDEVGKPIMWETADLPSDEHINSLIDAKLGVIENGYY
jgi:hypothetical protein